MILVALLVDGQIVDSEQCLECPVTLLDENTLVIAAQDEDFVNKIGVVETTLDDGSF